MNIRGYHVIADFFDCRELPTTVESLKEILKCACREAGATILATVSHEFSDGGMSCVVLLAESHCSAHIWPEHRYVSIDIYTCGQSADPWKVRDLLYEYFMPCRLKNEGLTRGVYGAL